MPSLSAKPPRKPRATPAFPLRSASFLFFFLLNSCATTPSGPSPSGWDNLKRRAESRQAVSGNLLLTTEVQGKSATVPAVLLVDWPDKIRLELQDPVGGTLGILVIEGERFWLFQAKNPEILTGPLRHLPVGLMPRLPAQELVGVLLARPDLARLEKGERREGRAVWREKGEAETLLWGRDGDPSEWTREKSGESTVRAFFADFEAKSGQHFPAKLRLEGPGPDGKTRSILFSWKDWDPSVPKEKKLFQIPQQQTFGRKIKALP